MKFEIFKKKLYTAENSKIAKIISKEFNKSKSVRIFKQVIQQTIADLVIKGVLIQKPYKLLGGVKYYE